MSLTFCIGSDYGAVATQKNEKRNGIQAEIHSVFQPDEVGGEITAGFDLRPMVEIPTNYRSETDETKEKKTDGQKKGIQDGKNKRRGRAIKKGGTYRGRDTKITR